mgnify:CR=1 FL=1
MLDRLGEGLRATVLGMGVVFVALGALSYMLGLFSRIFGFRASEQVATDAQEIKGDTGAESEVAAAIAAVLAMFGCTEGSVKITSVSRVDQ